MTLGVSAILGIKVRRLLVMVVPSIRRRAHTVHPQVLYTTVTSYLARYQSMTLRRMNTRPRPTPSLRRLTSSRFLQRLHRQGRSKAQTGFLVMGTYICE